jgi:hypothetical protein
MRASQGRICGDREHPNTTTGECADFHNDYSMGVRQSVRGVGLLGGVI